jgi:hypothetical protein
LGVKTYRKKKYQMHGDNHKDGEHILIQYHPYTSQQIHLPSYRIQALQMKTILIHFMESSLHKQPLSIRG